MWSCASMLDVRSFCVCMCTALPIWYFACGTPVFSMSIYPIRLGTSQNRFIPISDVSSGCLCLYKRAIRRAYTRLLTRTYHHHCNAPWSFGVVKPTPWDNRQLLFVFQKQQTKYRDSNNVENDKCNNTCIILSISLVHMSDLLWFIHLCSGCCHLVKV